jgi:DNA-binding response OmpR family regulator
MDICCPRCGTLSEPAGHEDGRAYFACPRCRRVWSAPLSAFAALSQTPAITRVMVVDDSEQMVGLLAMWLSDEGCDVVTALSGIEALDVAATYYPDIVFLDVVMPPPDGFRVCEALRQRLAPEVILMTGVSNPRTRLRAAELGVVSLLQKPFTQEAALAAYAAALERCKRDPLARLREHFGSLPRARRVTSE